MTSTHQHTMGTALWIPQAGGSDYSSDRHYLRRTQMCMTPPLTERSPHQQSLRFDDSTLASNSFYFFIGCSFLLFPWLILTAWLAKQTTISFTMLTDQIDTSTFLTVTRCSSLFTNPRAPQELLYTPRPMQSTQMRHYTFQYSPEEQNLAEH